MSSKPQFLQGIYDFEGQGMHTPFLLDPRLTYVVPAGNEAQFVYFRGGNTSEEVVCVIAIRDGEPMRYFPIGAKSGAHIALRVVEDLLAETRIELHLAAPEGTTGQVVVDVGLMEI
jgi:assimilatory nitrate reductase catalytic subunit